MSSLERNLHNRAWLVERLRAEVIGPDPAGAVVAFSETEPSVFAWEEFRKPKRQANGEEILWQDSPIKRYGAGILFPFGVTELKQLAEEAGTTPAGGEDLEPSPDIRIDEQQEKKIQDEAARARIAADESDNDDVTLANAYRPSALGVSFLADFSQERTGFRVEIGNFCRAEKGGTKHTPAGTYRALKVHVGSEKVSERLVWLRQSLVQPDGAAPAIEVDAVAALNTSEPIRQWVPGLNDRLQAVVVSRRLPGEDASSRRIVTVSLVNRQLRDSGRVDERCFFQMGFRITGKDSGAWILPYPQVLRAERKPEDEEEVLRLLYRDRQIFAIGHGCAADWPGEMPKQVATLWTDCLPTYETSSVSADLIDSAGHPLKVSMRKLAGLDAADDGFGEISNLIAAYRDWIAKLENLAAREPAIPADLEETARVLIRKCKDCLARIEDGIALLKSNSAEGRQAKNAFRLANHAMLIAQLRASRDVRNPKWEDEKLFWDKPIVNPDPAVPNPDKGYWRAFQIAFLLATIRGICEPDHDDRRVVDLIWFPTGGGKTEAYLGLTAFTIFLNRLTGRGGVGANVIMRYTLRLLTAQQFQRAGLLFCAMEHLRKRHAELRNGRPFRIGMWVGGSTTPNSRADAKRALSALQRDSSSENPFVLLKCPWCNAKFGPSDDGATARSRGRGNAQRGGVSTYGYSLAQVPGTRAETVVFRCNDRACEFGNDPARPGNPPLPIVVIDEDIFQQPPELIIGTVDKFAMLAWKTETRSIFGIGPDGVHAGLPPTLIIQDELHLISGPLGSMVGAYETVIEELCTAEIRSQIFVPKIIASTATISRADDQVRSLYAREKVMLFPPSGLEAGDSFFAQEARDENGALKPGRLYAGVLAPGHGSLQTTEARIFATLLQYPAVMPVVDGDESERDPWWTLIAFFNSLRELGGAATLLVADARDYLRVILDRHGIPYSGIRQLLNWEELTSRIRSDKIPEVIQKLEKTFRRDARGFPVDALEACLASNIIEVGVDIERLGLMVIVGQPKTTSQYIQVSSRVGRSLSCPGLAVITYSQSKPRDRSHYERFRSYHQRLYAQVEPTSVTPFSPPAVERALHGIIVAATRQFSPVTDAESPRPFPLSPGSQLRARIEKMIARRAAIVDKSEARNVHRTFLQRLNEWKAWNPALYGQFGAPPQDAPLMYPAGSRESPDWHGHSWPTLSSLRDVDATCEADVTAYYTDADLQVSQ
jgi:hypothetical protein